MVWLSEIILQQTRVDQGLPYYLAFVEAFPTITDLANANEQEVLRLWQGLGYYSRARNLHATAKNVATSMDGIFPNSYDDIIKLKGIGPYTAAAIASICFQEAMPVVDGNVFRFASRMFGIHEDISKASTRKVFEKLLTKVISKKHPGEFNQGMMEYGATVCTPSPACEACEFRMDCVAYAHKNQHKLPVKTAKIKTRKRFLHYLVFFYGHEYLMKKREGNDVWAHLYDFPQIEGEIDQEEVLNQINNLLNSKGATIEISSPFKHVLSHQKIEAVFYLVGLKSTQFEKLKGSLGCKSYSQEEIVTLPKPKLIVNYFQQYGIKS